jgi:hypothetical protein
MPINIQAGSRLYSYQDNTKPNVWMSHGDEATKLPDGFSVVAKSEQVRRGTEQNGARRAGRGGGGDGQDAEAYAGIQQRQQVWQQQVWQPTAGRVILAAGVCLSCTPGRVGRYSG